MSAPDLIIFDCDGTLSRSDEAYYHAFCDALTTFSYPAPDSQTYQEKYSGLMHYEIIRLHGEALGLSLRPDVEREYLRLEPSYLVKYLTAVEGAAEAVDRLQKNHATCVASNASRAGLEYLLGNIGLRYKFPDGHIFSAEMVDRPKPAPDVFLHAARTLGVDPDKTIVIEDSNTGVRAATAAGIRVIGFAGTSPHPEEKMAQLKASGAAQVFLTWPEITSYIESLSA